MRPGSVHAMAIEGIPMVQKGDNIVNLILERVELQEGDVIIIASKIISKSEGRLVKASDVSVSARAKEIAERNGFDPVHVQLALSEAVEVIRDKGVLITETKTGLICNFSGVDKSNVPADEYVLLPKNADKSATAIRKELMERKGLKLAIIISDTQGRPWRKGSINVAIGCAGINAFKYNKGKRDLHGRILKRSTVCQIDELAAFVEPLMGQANEQVPVVVVRGYEYTEGEELASEVFRRKEDDMFR